MKAVRIFLLILILIGLGLIVTQSLWVPTVVNVILQYQRVSQQTPEVYRWISLPDAEKQGIICTDDSNSLTYCSTLLTKVDAATFLIAFYVGIPRPPVALLANFAKDKNHVYFLFYSKLEIISGADPISFMPLQFTGLNGYAKDKNYAYWDSFSIPNVDLPTFTVVGNGYAKDKNHVYAGELYQSGNTTGFVVQGADPASFVVVSNAKEYDAQDKNNKYFEGSAVQTTSRTILGHTCSDGSCMWYEKDATHVYDDLGNIIQKADPSTFTPILTSSGMISSYEVDKNYAFSGDAILASANPKKLVLVNDTPWLATDGTYAYAYGTLIPRADPETLTNLTYPGGISDAYAKDKNNVYYCLYDSQNNVEIIQGADPSTFVVIGQLDTDEYTYAKDKNHVYWDDRVIPNADLATFVLVPNGYSNGITYDAQDINHKYFQGQIVQ